MFLPACDAQLRLYTDIHSNVSMLCVQSMEPLKQNSLSSDATYRNDLLGILNEKPVTLVNLTS